MDKVLTVSGEVISVKKKTSSRGGYWGITIEVPLDEGGRPAKFWFPYGDDDDPPEKGDDITIKGEVSGTSDDGNMTFMKDTYIQNLDHKCDHEVLQRKGHSSYVCDSCGISMSVN